MKINNIIKIMAILLLSCQLAQAQFTGGAGRGDIMGRTAITSAPDEPVQVSLTAGWNLVGLPVQAEHSVYTDLFAGAQPQTLFGFTQAYVQETTLTAGRGYWIRYEQAGVQSLQGPLLTRVDAQLNTGWNLISGPATTVALADISDPEGVILPGTLFGFTQAYLQKEELEPGMGYWVRASQAGSVGIGGVSTLSRQPSGNPVADLADFDRIDLIAAVSASTEGASGAPEEVVWSRLYFAGDLPHDLHELAFTLPPAAPGAAAPDARFPGDRWVIASRTAEVELTEAATPSPVALRITPAGQHDGTTGQADAGTPAGNTTAVYQVTQWSHGQLASTARIPAGAQTTLLPGTTRVTVEQLDEREIQAQLPSEFVLEQNVPNPFNPSTTIRYALPEAAQVRLEIYTIAGQRVAVLAEGEQSAGWHTVTFDASRFSSGVYMYRLAAGSYVETRKMTLIK
jgi:hypothetical protein